MPTKLRRMIRWLKRHYPVTRPVIVRVVPSIPGAHGICLLSEDRALIRLTASSEALMTETLLEEWCHVLRHETPVRVDDEHDGIFWAIYGTVTKSWRGE